MESIFNIVDLKAVLSFVGGGGFLWVLNYALSLRKQRKDEFVILRETWKSQFEEMRNELAETKEQLKLAREEIAELKDELEAAIGQKMIYQEKLKDLLNDRED